MLRRKFSAAYNNHFIILSAMIHSKLRGLYVPLKLRDAFAERSTTIFSDDDFGNLS
jgi:hypothetical protein